MGNDTNHEKERVEWVFNLTGGELSDTPWKFKARRLAAFPPEEEKLLACTGQYPYWYEGVPEYITEDFPEEGTYRTVVADILWGHNVELVDEEGATWKLVKYFRHSGEVECPARQYEKGQPSIKRTYRMGDTVRPGQTRTERVGLVTAAHTDGGTRCILCEEKLKEPHRYIYLGDGWAELVYRLEEAPEEEEDETPTEPEDGDITTSDHEHWFQYGKLYFTGDEAGLQQKMDEDKFWPNVWFISDHGNPHLIEIPPSE